MKAHIGVGFQPGPGLARAVQSLFGKIRIVICENPGCKCHYRSKVSSCHRGNRVDQKLRPVFFRHDEIRMGKGGQLMIYAAIGILHL